MNLLERVLTLLRANLNTLVEKADDPEKVLQQLRLDMRNQLMQVKTQVATAIAESRKLQSRIKEKKAEAETWQKKAEQAIQQDNDAAARVALTRYNEFTRDVQLEQLSHEQFVEEQLNELKAKKRSAKEPPLLHEGNPHLSTLIPTPPQDSAPAKKRASSKSEQHEPPVTEPTAKELEIEKLKKLMEQ